MKIRVNAEILIRVQVFVLVYRIVLFSVTSHPSFSPLKALLSTGMQNNTFHPMTKPNTVQFSEGMMQGTICLEMTSCSIKILSLGKAVSPFTSRVNAVENLSATNMIPAKKITLRLHMFMMIVD